MTKGEIDRLVELGKLQRVEINRAHALELIHQAAQHLRSARAVREIDPIGAYELVYEAARRALTALLADAGFRPTRTGGHHVITLACGELANNTLAAALPRFEVMRRTRNQVAYPMPEQAPFDIDIFDEDLETAVIVVDECRTLLRLED